MCVKIEPMETDKLIITIIGVATAIILGVIVFTSMKTTNPASREVLLANEPNVKGASLDESKLVIVEFSDFECPFCAQYPPILNSLVTQYPQKLSIVYRHFPLPNRARSPFAARAAEAAGMQGKFWEYTETLFLNQGSFTDEDFVKYADELGLDVAKFEEDYKSKAVADRVASDTELSRKLGLPGTPSFFLIQGDEVEKLTIRSIGDLETRVVQILGAPVDNGESNDGQDGDTGGDEGDNGDEGTGQEGDQSQTTKPKEVDESTLAPNQQALINGIKQDIVSLEAGLGNSITADQIKVNSIEAVDWSDSSLGCPVDGMMYTQVITPGYDIQLMVNNSKQYTYHTNRDERFVKCE